MQRSFSAMFSWEFILIFYLVLMVTFLMSGCSTFVSTTVGDTTYSTGVYLDKEVRNDEQI